MHARARFTACLMLCAVSAASAQDRARRIDRVRPAQPTGARPDARFRIIYPPGFDKTNKLTPVVFALHGYGGTMDSMASLWTAACARTGAILVVAQGAGDVGQGFSWSGYEDAGKVIEAARRQLRKTVKLDSSAPRVLTGFSQGAWATYSLGLRYPATYRRLIPMSGMFRAKTSEIVEPLTEQEKQGMKRWRIYVMTGIQDKQELVSNNHWLVGQLEMMGTAVCAPFMTRHDPSWSLYQDIGHAAPGEGEALVNELVRALTFVLQPDERDRANWTKVDRDWKSKAVWMKSGATSKPVTPGKSPKGRR